MRILLSRLAFVAAVACLAPPHVSLAADDAVDFSLSANVEPTCSFVMPPTALSIASATGSLVGGMKATGEFTYKCNYNNGPMSVSISSNSGALMPDGIAAANGGTPIPYGICLRGPIPGSVRCDAIPAYAPISISPTVYNTSTGLPGFGAPNAGIEAIGSYGFELQNPTPVTVAGSWTDVVTFTLNP